MWTYLGPILAGAALIAAGVVYYRLDKRAREQDRSHVELRSELDGLRISQVELRSELDGLRSSLAMGRDAYLGLAEVSVELGQRAYRPELVDAVRYTGNAVMLGPEDMILQMRQLTPADRDIIWSAGLPLQSGDELEVVDNRFHDLRAGTSFVKVKRRSDSAIGYIPLQIFFAKTVPLSVPESPYPPLVASIDDRDILIPYPIGPIQTKSVLDAIDGKSLADAFATPLTGGEVHPVTLGNQLLLLLLGLLSPLPDEGLHERVIPAAQRMFDEYVFPSAVNVRPGAIAWPNTYDFAIPWGDELKAPWFSGYSNGTIAAAAALMFRLTKEKRYAEIARQAVAWMKLPAEQGGGLYHDGPSAFVAEYPSLSPAQPNISVLDGEMIAAISVYDTAVLLDDPEMLRFAAQLAYSLVNKADMATTADGRVQNARYQWLINTESYIQPMQRFAALLGILTKDRRMLDHARNWRQSDVYWPD